MLGAVPEPLDPGGLVILAAVENARDDHASAEIQRTALQPESFEAVVDIRPFQPAQSAGLDEALIVILVRIVTHHVEGATEFGALFDGPALVRLLQTVDAQFHRPSVPLDRKRGV